ncbi:MAG: hypothetical protein JWM59_1538 [Verrucomicrobiales bacterium]|nr:hypothetical protein [Verrucomicrobiales bacterium]
MADKDLTIKIRTTGDPSGAKKIIDALDGTGDASRRASDSIVKDYRKVTDAAATAGAAMRAGAVADTGGGRSWSIPGAGAVSTRGASGGGGSVSAPTVAPSVAPVSVALRSAGPSGGGGGGGLDAIAPAAEQAANAARGAAQGLDGVADSAAKIKAEKLEDAGKAAKDAGSGAESSAADMITAFDSVSNEITDVIDGWKQLKEEGQSSSQAEGLKKAADAAATLTESITAVVAAEAEAAGVAAEGDATKTEAREEATAAQEESTEAAEKGAEAEAEGAGDVAEHVGAVVDALEEKKKKTKEATEEEKKHGAEAEKTSGNLGSAAMSIAQLADDAQYGIGGIVNNIPGLVQGLGLGSGVAGVLGIAFVALNQLAKRFDLFGSDVPEAVQKTVKELHEMTTALARSRNEAAESAEDWKKSFENGQALKKELDEIGKAYKTIADNIKLAADARRQLNIANIEESNAELGLRLAEIELKRSEGKITDLEAEQQSQNTKRAYGKAQLELSQEGDKKDLADREASLEALRKEREETVNHYGKVRALSKDLVRDKDFTVMEKTRDTAMAQLEELRRKSEKADAALEKRRPAVEAENPADRGVMDWSTGQLVNAREFYLKDEKEAADKARLALERGEKYARQSVDAYNKVKEAREKIGPDLQDKTKADEFLKGGQEKITGQTTRIKEEEVGIATARKQAEIAARTARLTQRTDEILGKTRIVGLTEAEKADRKQKIDREREYAEKQQDEADAKRFEAMKKTEEAAKKAEAEDAAKRRVPLPADAGESQVDKQQKAYEENKRLQREKEARDRELAAEQERQARLSETMPDGNPYLAPTDRSAPVRPGFPLTTLPGEIARPSPLPPAVPQITPLPAMGEDTSALTSPLDDFMARKGKGASAIGGGDPRLNSLKAATDALRDGGTKAEYQKLIDVLNSLVDTVLAQRKEDREQIMRTRKEAEKNVDRLKKARN